MIEESTSCKISKTSGKQRLFINFAPLRNLRIVCPKYAYYGYEDASVDEHCLLTWVVLIGYLTPHQSAVQEESQVSSIIDYIDE